MVSAILAGAASGGETLATPQFARENGLTCNACHSVVPRLNANGIAFAADGYRVPETVRASDNFAKDAAPRGATIPLAAWVTLRHEDRGGSNAEDSYLPKVELISGGPIGEHLSYFVEWRLVSLSLGNDGSLSDRGGRFEDLFLDWSLSGRHSLKLGQYRALNQVDVSQRLSVDEPLLFSTAVPTGSSANPRIAGLERFSPSGRSPSLGWSWRSLGGATPGDGLFHFVTLPFVGEFSIPLGGEASQRASFELRGPKGVFVESFYRRGVRSVGMHAFVDDRAWLATLLATYDWRDVFVTGGVGVDDRDEGSSRTRGSLEAEYLVRTADRVRAALGVRVEDLSDDGRRARFVPYVVVTAPNMQYNLVFQAQYVSQEQSDLLTIDLSFIF